MTNRQRIVLTLQCQPTDRPPFPWWLGFAPWGETLQRWRRESGIADLNVQNYFAFEPFWHALPLEYGPFPHFEEKTLAQDDTFITSTDFRGITRRNRRDGSSMPEFLSHPVATPADWQRYKYERLQPPLDDRLAKINFAKLQSTDAPIQLGEFPWGVFGTARDLLGAEGLLYAFYDHPDLVHDIMHSLVSLWLNLFEAVTQKIHIDHIHIWEDMSGRNGSLISIDMVKEFMMPQYDRIHAFAKSHKIPVISVDSDGDLSALVPVMAAHGINAFLPFEVQAGSDILQYRKQYPRLALIGGLDKNALALDKPSIHQQLDRAAKMLAQPGYIVGFDHLIPPNVPWQNFKYAVTHLRKMTLGN